MPRGGGGQKVKKFARKYMKGGSPLEYVSGVLIFRLAGKKSGHPGRNAKNEFGKNKEK